MRSPSWREPPTETARTQRTQTTEKVLAGADEEVVEEVEVAEDVAEVVEAEAIPPAHQVKVIHRLHDNARRPGAVVDEKEEQENSEEECLAEGPFTTSCEASPPELEPISRNFEFSETIIIEWITTGSRCTQASREHH